MENENKEIQEKVSIENQKTDKTVLFYFLIVVYVLAIGIKTFVSALFNNDFSLNAEINIILYYYIRIVFTPCIVLTLGKSIAAKDMLFINIFGRANYKNIRNAFKGLLILIVVYVLIFISINSPIEVSTLIISLIEFFLITTKKLIKLDRVDIKIKKRAEVVDNLLMLTTVFFIINLMKFMINYIPVIQYEYKNIRVRW